MPSLIVKTVVPSLIVMVEIEHATVAVKDLTERERGEMFLLLERYYLGVERQTFERDLAEKEHVMILRELAADGRLVGFSTLVRLDVEVCGRPLGAIFSGDTVVEEKFRRSRGLAYEVTRYFAALLELSAAPLYYVLICKGWRTYRILPFLFREFSPRFDKPTPAAHRRVMDAFCALKFPEEYDAESGLVVFRGQAQRVRPESAEAVGRARSDPHIEFFARKNPNHLRGDEMVCVAPVAEWNFTEAFHKLLRARG